MRMPPHSGMYTPGSIVTTMPECSTSSEFARMLGLPVGAEGCYLALLGLRVDGQLSSVVAVVEPKRTFGTRVSERTAPMAALFELAYLRFAERDASPRSSIS